MFVSRKLFPPAKGSMDKYKVKVVKKFTTSGIVHQIAKMAAVYDVDYDRIYGFYSSGNTLLMESDKIWARMTQQSSKDDALDVTDEINKIPNIKTGLAMHYIVSWGPFVLLFASVAGLVHTSNPGFVLAIAGSFLTGMYYWLDRTSQLRKLTRKLLPDYKEIVEEEKKNLIARICYREENKDPEYLKQKSLRELFIYAEDEGYV